MRPHTILLLLCSLAVADAGAPKCDKSYIQGAAPSEFTIDASKKLTCNNGKSIEYNEKRYEALKCDYQGAKGWEYPIYTWKDGPLTPPVNADVNLNIKCVPKACHKDLINGGDPSSGIEFPSMLYCPAGAVKINDAGVDKFGFGMQCELGGLWAVDGKKTTFKDTDAITVSCVERACIGFLVHYGDEVKRDNNKITCTKSDTELQIDDEPAKYNDLICAKDVGWTTSGNQTKIKEDVDIFAVACVQKPPTTTTDTPATENSGAHKGEAPQMSTMLLVCCAILGRNFF